MPINRNWGGPLYGEVALVENLIERMKTAMVPSASELKSRARRHREVVAKRMIDTGESYGQASGGALAFLNADNAIEQIKSIDNDLQSQVRIVVDSFEEYLERDEIPAPYYPWRVCIILRKMRQHEIERAFLSAWCIHFAKYRGGARYQKLVDRALACGAWPDKDAIVEQVSAPPIR